MNKISFIIPNRGGRHLKAVFKNLDEIYGVYDREYIVVEQCDDEPFKKGQLYNIGIQRCHGDYLALQDNDIIHFRPIDLFGVLERTGGEPYLGFTHTSQIPSPEKPYVITDTSPRPYGFGAFLFASKKSMLKINGFSNLYIGWGCEDNEIGYRITCKRTSIGQAAVYRVPQDLGHITHVNRGDPTNPNVVMNKEILKSRDGRDPKLDGIRQTTCDVFSDTVEDGIRFIRVGNIGVTEGFVYQDLLDKRKIINSK